AKWLIGKLLPSFATPVAEPAVAATAEEGSKVELGFAVLLSLLCVGISVGVSLLATGGLDVSIIMLFLTTLGVVASFHRWIRQIKRYLRGWAVFYPCFFINPGDQHKFSRNPWFDFGYLFLHGLCDDRCHRDPFNLGVDLPD